MLLSRRDILAGTGGIGLFWPLSACAQRRRHTMLHPHGINEGAPDQGSGFFIDGAKVKTPWTGKGALTANGAPAGTSTDVMTTNLGLKASPGVTHYDFVTKNVASFYLAVGDAVTGLKVIPVTDETTRVAIKDRDTCRVEVKPTGKGEVVLHVIPTDWRKRWDAGEYLSPDFLARTKQLGVCSTRFMDSVRTNGSKIVDARPLLTDDSYYHGLPVEVLADICNATGTDMVLNIPAHIGDALLLEWIRTAVERLDQRLKIVVEYSNEVWNSSFEQSRWALAQGNLLYSGTSGPPASAANPDPKAASAAGDPNAQRKFYGAMAGRVANAVKTVMFGEGAKTSKPTPAALLASRVKVSLAWKRSNPDAWQSILQGYESTGAPRELINDISYALYPQITTAERDQFIALAKANDTAGGVALIRKVWLDKALPKFPLHMAEAEKIGPWVKMNLYESSIDQLVMHPPFIKDKTLLPVMVDYCIALTHSAEAVKMYGDMHDAFIAAGGTTAHYFTKIGVDSEYGVFNVFSSAQDVTGWPIAAELARRNAQARLATG